MQCGRMARQAAAVAAAALALAAAQASRAATAEKIDCNGGEVTVSGDHRVVELSNCSVVRVVGDHDTVSGVLARHAKVTVTGHDNTVRLSPPEGVSFSHVKDEGQGNTLHGPQ